MRISNIWKSPKRERYEVMATFGAHGRWVISYRDKTTIVKHQKKLWCLHHRLRYIAEEFINIRIWYPEQAEVSAEQMIDFLFHNKREDMEGAVRKLLIAAEIGDWDGFFYAYFRELKWIEDVPTEEWDRKLGELYLTKHYKKVLKELMDARDLETMLFLRLLMETGISVFDVYRMSSSCIEGKKVRVQSSRISMSGFYRYPDGSLPQISKDTIRIAEALDRVQGKWFTKPCGHYTHLIHILWNLYHFSFDILEGFRVNLKSKESC